MRTMRVEAVLALTRWDRWDQWVQGGEAIPMSSGRQWASWDQSQASSTGSRCVYPISSWAILDVGYFWIMNTSNHEIMENHP